MLTKTPRPARKPAVKRKAGPAAAKQPATAARRPDAAEPRLIAKLVRIGNSRGVRLPKAVIEQAKLTDEVELTVRRGEIVIRAAAARNPREGWAEQIKAALAEHGDDTDDWADWQGIANEFDEKEWTW